MSRKAAVWLAIGVALVAAGVLLGVTSGWDYTPGEWDTETVFEGTAADVAEVEVLFGSMEIRVYDAWDDALSVDVSKPVKGRVAVTRSGDTLTVREAETNWLYDLFHPRDGYAILWLPASYTGSLRVETGSGEVGFNGPVNPDTDAAVATGSGTVGIYETALRSLRVTAGSGDVYLGGAALSGRLSGQTGSGTLYVRELSAAGVSLTTGSGTLYLMDSAADAAALETSSGEVTLEKTELAAGEVVTASGDVWADLPGREEDYALTLSTASGEITGARESAGGEKSLSIRTSSGDIRISFDE